MNYGHQRFSYSTPTASIAGWIDWSGVRADALSIENRRSKEGWEVEVAGLRVLARGRRCSFATRRGAVAVALGSPVVGGNGTPLAAEELLDLLAAQGSDCLKELHGNYSLIAIDLQRRTALLAVDRFGVLPICYAIDGPRLAFSDRADDVPALAERGLDAQAIYDYLYFHVIPAPRTIFRNVARLDLGQRLEFTPRGTTLSTHWAPEFLEDSREDLSALKSKFRAVLRQSVERAIPAGSEIGCFLSGGTDSSTVAGLVGEVTGRPARTFSIGFDAEGYDEMEYARIAARHFGTRHTEYYVTPADLLEGIPKVARHFDQPFGNSSAVPAYYCARVAREAGVDTLLAGDGGDELFGGNSRYAVQRMFSAYSSVPAVVRAALVEPLLRGVPGIERVPIGRKAASYVEKAKTPLPDRLEDYNLLERVGVREVLTGDFLKQVDVSAPREAQRAYYARCRAGAQINRLLAYDWKFTLADSDLPKVTGSASLARMEVRYPLLDDAVVDFSLRLDPELKLRRLKLRYFFKEALKDFLPPQIITKKKQGFGLPFGVWLTRDARLHEFAFSSLNSLVGRGLVRKDFVGRLQREYLNEHPGYYGSMVWILMMLDQWFDRDNRSFPRGPEVGSDPHPLPAGIAR